MSTVSTRRKIVAVAASAALWAFAVGSGSAAVSYLRDGPFAGRGDHRDVTMTIARIMMARADAPEAVADPFVAQ